MAILPEGIKAPAFKGIDQNGNKISLADYKGKKVILFFYPEDDTPTCTQQACNLRDNYSELTKRGLILLGVSPDDEKSHAKFAAKFNLPFPLIADPDKKIIDAYGVFGEKKLYGHTFMGIHRTTYIINEKGMIEKVIARVLSKIHTGQILKALETKAKS